MLDNADADSDAIDDAVDDAVDDADAPSPEQPRQNPILYVPASHHHPPSPQSSSTPICISKSPIAALPAPALPCPSRPSRPATGPTLSPSVRPPAPSPRRSLNARRLRSRTILARPRAPSRPGFFTPPGTGFLPRACAPPDVPECGAKVSPMDSLMAFCSGEVAPWWARGTRAVDVG